MLGDDKSTIATLREMLKRLGFATAGSSDPQELLKQIGAGKYRVVVCDREMPGMDGLTFLEWALAHDPGIYIIMMTCSYSIGSAIEAIKRGAYDYLPKPVEPLRLKKPLDDLAMQLQQQRRIRELEEKLVNDLKFHGIVGRSPAMLEVFDLVRKIARHYTSLLLTGQTGTGKELIASAAPNEPSEHAAICGVQLFCDGRNAAGEPVIWPRPRGIQRGHRYPPRAV